MSMIETHAMNKQSQWIPQIDRSRCTRCGDCATACPTGALAEVNGMPAVVRPSACTYCAACESICPMEAIGLPYRISFITGPSQSN
ncbi:MAG TPA: 4Fe-4S binding protein [Aggregatilinea sp.]|uniref:ATP-binding protein n=1 Tax=Aggregatilinea sp. TaxID=2806333 RepID=UPI002B7CF8B5|nr:4Fe-4S binding protein [Aggregatilinea sp.]HML20253.1 4Fe-4S binding protein [Aggregatilinea sp.]